MAFKKKDKKPKEPKEQKPYITDEGEDFESAGQKAGLGLSMIIIAAVLGFVSGFIVWGAFVGSMVLTDLLWDPIFDLQESLDNATSIGGWWLPLVVTTLGGLIIGLWTKYTQAMPIPMEAVMAEVKKNGKFGFKRPFATIIGFLLPLVFGGAIGPEAGMTGLTAHACTAVGGALRRRGIVKKGIADVSTAAAFSGMFGNPLMGIVVSASDGMPDKDLKKSDGSFDPYTYNLKRKGKIILYTISALAAALGANCFTSLTGASFGFPRFDTLTLGQGNVWVGLLCLVIGFVAALIYQASKHYFGKLSIKMKDYVVLKPVIAGLIIGIIAIWCPMVLFPGEEQLFELQENWNTAAWTAGLLFATGFLKCVAAPMCLKMGWEGGGIFPLIFSGAALGYATSLVTGVDALFCVCITTSVFIAGSQRKLPISLAFLLLAFPVSSVLWMLLAVIIGVVIPMPKAWFPDAKERKKIHFKNKKHAADIDDGSEPVVEAEAKPVE